MMPRPAPARCVNGHCYDNYLSKCPTCKGRKLMQGFTFNSAGLGTELTVHDDLNNGFALEAEKFAVSFSEDDAVRLRNWLNLKYPI